MLRVVPRDFREEVERARRSDQRADLRLLGEEARTFSWSTEGLRTVGRAQFDLAAARGAKETFEWLRDQRPEDVEANQRLATIYERLSKEDQRQDYLTLSNQAIQRVIDSLVPGSWDRAEAYALKARNIKSCWEQTFSGKTGPDARVAALQAPELNEALESYASGFRQDLNHFYSGVNALALLRIRIDLARALPDTWTSGFDADEDAQRELDACAAQFVQFAAAVRLSLEASQQSLARRPDPDKQLWIGIGTADHALLTANRPKAVAQRYREALADAPRFAVDSVRQQLEFFAQLDVRTEFVKEVLPVVQELGGSQDPAAGRTGRLGRVLFFTGHMVDAPDRTKPTRFPPTEAAEREARRMIREAVVQEQALESDGIVAICGGACGGDILFHEVCAELGVESRLFLALPPDQFSAASVSRGGPQWIERFFNLCQRLTPRRPARPGGGRPDPDALRQVAGGCDHSQRRADRRHHPNGRRRVTDPLLIEAIEAIPIRAPLERVYHGSTYHMTHRATVLVRVVTAGGVVGEAYAGDEDASLAEIVTRDPVRVGSQVDRAGLLRRGALLGARLSGHVQHPARPQDRAGGAGGRRRCRLGRGRQGAGRAAVAAVGRIPRHGRADRDRRLLRQRAVDHR